MTTLPPTPRGSAWQRQPKALPARWRQLQRASLRLTQPQEETLMKGAQKPKKGDKKPAQKTLKEKRQDKRNAAKGNSGLQ